MRMNFAFFPSTTSRLKTAAIEADAASTAVNNVVVVETTNPVDTVKDKRDEVELCQLSGKNKKGKVVTRRPRCTYPPRM